MAKQEKTAAELYREERKERLAKAAKRNSKKSHGVGVSGKAAKAITAVIALVIVAALAFSVVNSTGVLERSKVTIKVGENEVALGEYGYYYISAYSAIFNQTYEIESQMSGYGSMFTGYDMYSMPDEQSYTGEIEGIENPTWADYFSYYAEQQLKYKQIALDYAKENNITLDEEDLAEVNETIEQWETQAAQSNYSLTKYLQANYGKALSAGVFKKILEDQALVTKVEETKTEEFKASYTDEKVLEVYNKDLSTYGAVTFRSYAINAETTTTTDSDGNESTDVSDESMAVAKADANAFVEKVTDEKSFVQAAYEAEKAKESENYKEYLKDDSLTLSEDTRSSGITTTDEKASKWLFSADVKAGDTFISEEEGTGYVVYYMVDPVHKAPDTIADYTVRHILVKFPTEDDTNTETDAEQEEEIPEIKTINKDDYKDVVIDIDVDSKAIEEDNIVSYNKAIDVLTEYLEGDKSEESFGKLAKEYTEDSNGDVGGIYEDVTLGQMVSEFEDWSTDESRKYGDVGMVETTYGYHLMYFVGYDITTWDGEIKDDLASEELAEFREELNSKEGYDITVVDADAVATARENTMTLAKNNIDYFASLGYYNY